MEKKDRLPIEAGRHAFILPVSDDAMLLGIKLPECPHPKGTMLKISLMPEGPDDTLLRGICCDSLCWSN